MATINGIQYSIKKCKDGILLNVPAFDVVNLRIEDPDFKKSDVLNYV